MFKKMIKLSATQEELFNVCYELNQEINDLIHSEIFIDFSNRRIECTENAMQKIMYYLSSGCLNDRLQYQIDNQISK